MSAPISLAMLRAVSARSTGEVPLLLLTIDHPDMTYPLRFVDGSHVDVVSNGNTFVPGRFDVLTGAQEPERIPEVQLSIDTVTPLILDALQSLDPGPTVTVQLVLASALDTIVHEETDLQLAGLDSSGLTSLGGQLLGDPIELQPYPGPIMGRAEVPGIFVDPLDDS